MRYLKLLFLISKLTTSSMLLFLFVLILGSFSCSTETRNKNSCYSKQEPPRNTSKVSIEQGVWGDVWFWKGDFMPGVVSGEICQVRRTVYIYEPTTSQDVDRIDYSPFISNIYTNQVATTQSDADGFFQVSLAPGTYSVFIREGDHYYWSFIGPGGFFGQVTVGDGEVSEILINITTEAVF